MSADLPIACSLGATELPARLDEMAALGADALVEATLDARRARMRFAASAGVRDRLERLVAAEARCCGFLAFRLHDDEDGMVLIVEAPEGAELVLAEWVRTFGEPCGAGPSTRPATKAERPFS